jgi:hypothetical protein
MLEVILKQKELVDDHLGEYLELLENAENITQQTAFLWCIETLVPLKTMGADDWLVISYERLCEKPKEETLRLLGFLGIRGYNEFQENEVRGIIPITTRRESAILKNINPINAWRIGLSNDQINQILDMVAEFKLDHLYDNNFYPRYTPSNLLETLEHMQL